jgi:hypothetical protein
MRSGSSSAAVWSLEASRRTCARCTRLRCRCAGCNSGAIVSELEGRSARRLGEAFVGARLSASGSAPGVNDSNDDGAFIDARVHSFAQAAAFAWPEVPSLAEPASMVALAQVLGARMSLADVTDERAAELAIALACARFDAAALSAFDRAYLAPIRPRLLRMRLSSSAIDDVLQETRRKLWVTADGPPPVLQYAGTGRLRGLVYVMASRLAIDDTCRQKGLQPCCAEKTTLRACRVPGGRLARGECTSTKRQVFRPYRMTFHAQQMPPIQRRFSCER